MAGLTLIASGTEEVWKRERQWKRQFDDILSTGVPKMFTAEEAKGFGVDLSDPEAGIGEDWADWLVKVSPDETSENGFSLSYLSPDKYEYFPDLSVADPTGKKYTADEWKAEVAGYEAQTGDYEALKANLVPALQRAFTETITSPGGKQTGIIYDPYTGEPSPELTPALDTTFSELSADEAMTQLQEWVSTTPNEFVQFLQSKGRTADTETILKTLYPDISDGDMTGLFGGQTQTLPATQVDAALSQWHQNKTSWWEGAINSVVNFGQAAITTGSAGLLKFEGQEKIAKQIKSMPWYTQPLGIIDPKMLSLLSIGGAYADKFAGRPWEQALMGIQWAGQTILSQTPTLSGQKPLYDTSWEDFALKRLGDNYREHGIWSGLFSEDVSQIWEDYNKGISPAAAKVNRAVSDWLNPVYLMPVGEGLGIGAKAITRVPLVGRSMVVVAGAEKLAAVSRGVTAIETGITAPISEPVGYALKGVSWAGSQTGRVAGEWAAKRLTNRLPVLGLIDAEGKYFGRMVTESITDSITKKALSGATRIPVVGKGVKAGVERTLGNFTFVKAESALVEDIVGRASVGNTAMRRMGANLARVKKPYYQALISDPVKYFGFEKGNAFSPMMQQRLLPAYTKESAKAGTLEHILTHPEMYDWSFSELKTPRIMYRGAEKITVKNPALRYITDLMADYDEVGKWLAKNGIPEGEVGEAYWTRLLDDGGKDPWIHRVVVGKINPEGELLKVRGSPGIKGSGLGGTAAFEMQRKAPTMADGIAWRIMYGADPYVGLGTYMEEAFKKVADKQAIEYMGQGMKQAGMEYTEIMGATGEVLRIEPGVTKKSLMEKYPELFESKGGGVVPKVELRLEEKQAAEHFVDLINRTSRGEVLPAPTLKAIERRFPELGRRLRNLSGEVPREAEASLKPIIEDNQKVIQNLRADIQRIKEGKVKTVTVVKEVEKPVEVVREVVKPVEDLPDDVILREAFKRMEYEDRSAYRATMLTQRDDAGVVLSEYQAEVESLQDYLKSDPLAARRELKYGKTRDLTALLTESGDWPESFTRKQAQMLLEGREILPSVVNKEGRVQWEYITDTMAEEFGMGSDKFVQAVKNLWQTKQKLKDLKAIMADATQRSKQIDHMVSLLDEIDGSDVVNMTYNYTDEMIPPVESSQKMPLPMEGEPEAGLQADIFGGTVRHTPKGKGEVTQISMDDYMKLVEYRKANKLPAPDVAVQPAIEGITKTPDDIIFKVENSAMPEFGDITRKQRLDTLKAEVKALAEGKTKEYWAARKLYREIAQQVAQPEIGKGYIMAPFAGGKIYDQAYKDAFNKFFGYEPGSKVLKGIADVSGIMRITKASLDFSAMAIQGLPSFGLAHTYLLTDPIVGAKLMGQWWRAFGWSIRGAFDLDSAYRMIAKMEGEAQERIARGGTSRAVDYFEALEAKEGIGGIAEKAMEKIPLNPFKRAEMSFYLGGEVVRNEFYRVLGPKATLQGSEFQLARMLDHITGIYDSVAAGVPITTRQFESSFAWFAPNYTRACLSVIGDIFRGGYTGAQARRALGGMISAGAIYYAAMQFGVSSLEGKDIEDSWEDVMHGFGVNRDPITGEYSWRGASDFMTMKVGNYRMGFGGFWYGMYRLAGNITDAITETGDKERIDLVRIVKNGSFNRKDNPFIYWWYSRSSPIVGTGLELASGQDYLGRQFETPADYAKYIMTRFEPIWMEQGINPLIPGLAQDNEVPEGLAKGAVIPSEMFGLRTFPVSSWTKFYDKAETYAARIPRDELDANQIGKDLTWQTLSKLQQQNLLSRYPDLNDLYTKAQADSSAFGSNKFTAWRQRLDEEKATYYGRGNDLITQLQAGTITTKGLRETWSEAGQNYGAAMETIENDPHYADVYQYFEDRAAQGDKYGFKDDIAMGEYEAILFGDFSDINGNMDWDSRDAALDAFRDKWGEEAYELVRGYYTANREKAGLNPLFSKLSDDKDKLGQQYWRIDPNAEDATAQRTAYRAANPEMDAALLFWGYGGKIQTIEAYNFIQQWCKDYAVPVDSLELALPPPSLINSYFEYIAIANEFGGSSTKAKDYRRANPNWDAWGQENWGWKPLAEAKTTASSSSGGTGLTLK